jgi:hypothetical protein
MSGPHVRPSREARASLILPALAAGAILLLASGQAAAQDLPGPDGPVLKGPPQQTLGAPSVSVPDAYKLNLLIRTTIIALNQANMTGNYSVLRDLGTPRFQGVNTDASLAEIFSGVRKRNLDLSPILFFDPKLIRDPIVQPNGILRLTGFIPTTPERLLFDMGFEFVADRWRLSAIVIDIQPAPTGPAGAESVLMLTAPIRSRSVMTPMRLGQTAWRSVRTTIPAPVPITQPSATTSTY